MPALEPPDTHHLSAALGWLELGNPVEAGEELARISASSLEHPDVLEIRWAVCAASKSWEAGLRAAELSVLKAPDRVSSWIHRAYALRRVKDGGLLPAFKALRPALEKFPNEPIIPYNLACYLAQLGDVEDAWEWLQKSFQAAGDAKQMKSMALSDKDLQPLWERIQKTA